MNLVKPKVGIFFILLFMALKAHGQRYQLEFIQDIAIQKITYAADGLDLEFCGLNPGQEYSVRLIKDRFNDSHVYIFNGNKSYTYDLVAGASCVNVQIDHEGMYLQSIAEDFPLRVVFEEKQDKVESRNSSFRAVPNNNTQAIVEEFVGDVCGEIVEGSIVAEGLLGNFSGGEDILGFESGIILSTIQPQRVVGPNRSPGDPPDENAFRDFDPDLRRLVGGSIFTNKRGVYDISVIEFDFIPTSDSISFEYVFASEEYCEYVNEFNDAFGFFLSGPGINGQFSRNAVNIALIPNSNDYVSINNVNHTRNTDYYINNTPNNPITHEDEVLECSNSLRDFPAPHADIFQMDGYTVPLTAKAAVIPCETYHLKLIIGDAFDDGFSSSVFLRSNSFRSTGDVYVEYDFPNSDSVLYEGCDQRGIVRFVRTDDGDQDLVVDVTTGGTARLGIDLDVTFGNQVVIPPGGVVEEEIILFEDLEDEGTETFSIDIGVACTCERPFYEFSIVDVPPMQLNLTDTTHCSNDGELILRPSISGGLPSVNNTSDYTYNWSTGATTTTVSVPPNTNEVYEVIVTDACGESVSDDAIIDSKETVTATLTGTAPQNCTDTAANFLNIEFTGDPPFYFTYAVDNQVTDTIATGNFEYQLPILREGLYELRSVSNDFCEGEVSGSVQIDFLPLYVSFDIDSIACGGEAEGAISVIELDDKDYSYRWNTGNTTNSISDLPAGDYSLTIESRTCEETFNFQLMEPPVLELSAEVVGVPDCSNPLAGAINLNVNGGVPNYSYQWSAMNGNRTLEDVNGLPSGDYVVSVTDQAGCEKNITTTIPRDVDLPDASIQEPDDYTCIQEEILLQAASEEPTFSYLWETTNGNLQGADNGFAANAIAPGVYSLRVRNEQTGCENYGFSEVVDRRTFPEVSLGTEEYFCRIPVLRYEVPFNAEYDYNWQAVTGSIVSGRQSAVLELDQPGLYELELTDRASGCATLDTLEVITTSVLPEADAGPDQILTCLQEELSLGASDNGSGDNLRIEWTGPNFIGTSTDSIIRTRVPGVYTIRIYNEINGCYGADEAVIDEDKKEPEIDAGDDGLYSCTQNFIPLNGVNLNTDRTNNVEWTTPDGVISGAIDAYLSEGNAPGIYYLNATDVFSGCEAVDSMRILPDPDLPLAEIDGDGILTCALETIELRGNTNPGNQFSWTLPNNTQNTTDLEITGRDSGQYVFEVTRPSDNCVNRTSVSLGLDLEPPLDSIRPFDLLYCSDLNETLEPFNPNVNSFEYAWSTTDGAILSAANEPAVDIEGAGLYRLQITRTRNGCTQDLQADVQEFDNVPTDFETILRQPKCPGDLGTVSFRSVTSGVGPYEYSINGNFSAQRNYVDLLPGDYTLSIRDINGCILEKDTTIIPPRDIFLTSNEGPVVSLGDRMTADVSSNLEEAEIDTFLWAPLLNSPSCTHCFTPSFIPLNPGEYTLEVIDTFGCRLETTFPVYVDTRVDIYVPNIFGPNFDLTENQLAQVFGRETAVRKVNKFYIFDRWGELVFQREDFLINDSRSGWDGTFKGQQLNTNVFVYMVEVELINGDVKIFKGDILLAN